MKQSESTQAVPSRFPWMRVLHLHGQDIERGSEYLVQNLGEEQAGTFLARVGK